MEQVLEIGEQRLEVERRLQASIVEVALALGGATERLRVALENGNVEEATRRLENLATRLLERGEDELAQQALEEAKQVAYTNALSDKGRKALKFQTRLLLAPGSSNNEEAQQS